MNKKITDKIKEMLTPEDLKVFEAAIEKMVATRVGLREEEMKNKYDALAEEYVTKKIAEESDKSKAALIEEYDAKLKSIEQKVVTKLGSFLDHVIVEQISDDTITKLAINEIAMPVVEQIKKVFGQNYIELDSDGSALLKQEQQKIAKLERELSNAHSKIMESENRLEKSATFLLISEKTKGLTESHTQRVIKMFKNKKFDEVQDTIDEFVSMIKESSTPAKQRMRARGTMEEIINEGDYIEETKPAINEEKEEFTFADQANRYLSE